MAGMGVSLIVLIAGAAVVAVLVVGALFLLTRRPAGRRP